MGLPRSVAKCPDCGAYAFYIVQTNTSSGSRRRRWRCSVCDFSQTTNEISNERYEQLRLAELKLLKIYKAFDYEHKGWSRQNLWR